MAQFIKHFVQDLTQDIEIRQCGTIVFNADNESNVVSVDLYNGGEPATISGTVIGAVIAPDGATVPVGNGTISGNTVSITLISACFALPGQIGVGIQVVTGSVQTTVLKAIYNVERFDTDTIVDPDERITLTLAEIEAKLDEIPTILSEAQAAVDGIEAQKDTMIASIASIAGQGTDTTLTQSGVAADAKAAGDQISDLKSALSNTTDVLITGDLLSITLTWEHGLINASGEETSTGYNEYARTIGFYTPTQDGTLNITKTALSGAVIWLDYNLDGTIVSRNPIYENGVTKIAISANKKYRFCITSAQTPNTIPLDDVSDYAKFEIATTIPNGVVTFAKLASDTKSAVLLNAKAYGVVANDSNAASNNRTIINQLLNAGNIVYFDAGAYYVDTTIQLKNDSGIIGQGSAATRIVSLDADNDVVKLDVTDSPTYWNVIVKGIGLQGSYDPAQVKTQTGLNLHSSVTSAYGANMHGSIFDDIAVTYCSVGISIGSLITVVRLYNCQAYRSGLALSIGSTDNYIKSFQATECAKGIYCNAQNNQFIDCSCYFLGLRWESGDSSTLASTQDLVETAFGYSFYNIGVALLSHCVAQECQTGFVFEKCQNITLNGIVSDANGLAYHLGLVNQPNGIGYKFRNSVRFTGTIYAKSYHVPSSQYGIDVDDDSNIIDVVYAEDNQVTPIKAGQYAKKSLLSYATIDAMIYSLSDDSYVIRNMVANADYNARRCTITEQQDGTYKVSGTLSYRAPTFTTVSADADYDHFYVLSIMANIPQGYTMKFGVQSAADNSFVFGQSITGTGAWQRYTMYASPNSSNIQHFRNGYFCINDDTHSDDTAEEFTFAGPYLIDCGESDGYNSGKYEKCVDMIKSVQYFTGERPKTFSVN